MNIEQKIESIKKELSELEAEEKKKHSKLAKIMGQFKSKENHTEEKKDHLVELEKLEKNALAVLKKYH